MGEEQSIASLRSRVAALVEEEGALLTQAFELSRAGGDRSGVDGLFAQVQAIQVQRNLLKKRIGDVLGSQRLHAASEVWKPGIYVYSHEVAGSSVRVRVEKGPLGLQVRLPGEADAVGIETLKGTFDGPVVGDDPGPDAAAHDARIGTLATLAPAPAKASRGRPAKKKPS